MDEKPSIKKNLILFAKTILKSFNPDSYKDLANRSTKESFSYFASMLALSFIVMMLIAIPKFAMMPSYINDEMKSFDTLEISTNTEMNSDFEFPGERPFITIDTNSNSTKLEKENILVTDDYIIYKSFFMTKKIPTSDIKDLKENSYVVQKLLFYLMIFMLPSLLLFGYALFFIKYLVLIGLGVLILYGILKIRNHDIKFNKVYKIGFYASTIMVLLDVLTIPYPAIRKFMLVFDVSIWFSVALVPVLLFFIYLFIAMLLVGTKGIKFKR